MPTREALSLLVRGLPVIAAAALLYAALALSTAAGQRTADPCPGNVERERWHAMHPKSECPPLEVQRNARR